jgi:hypothetical protein
MTHEHRGAQRYDGHDHIQIAVSIYVEVQQSYQMESGAEVPVFAEPYNVRVLYGEIELCDKDPTLPPGSSNRLASFPVAGAQLSAMKDGYFYNPIHGKDKLYLSLVTRMACSKYPPPKPQKWTWEINQTRFFADVNP